MLKIAMYVIIEYILSFILLGIGIYYDNSIANFFLNNQNPALFRFMDIFAFLGSWIGVLVIITAYLFVEKKRVSIPFWLAFGISMFITFLLKIFIVRERPWQIASGFDMNNSFPSGHATACFSALPFMKDRVLYYWLVFSILVILSRMYQGYHYLTDVVSGSLIGLTIALIVNYCFAKFNLDRYFERITKRLMGLFD